MRHRQDRAEPADLVERHFLIGHFRRLYYVSRLYHEPKPTWPTPDGIRYREVLHPHPRALRPEGRRPHLQPPPRPVRARTTAGSTTRCSSACGACRRRQRSDALFGQDADIDSYGGYAGNPAWMDWKLSAPSACWRRCTRSTSRPCGPRAPPTSCSTTPGRCATCTSRRHLAHPRLRVLEAGDLPRPPQLRDPVHGDVRPEGPALEGLGQPVEDRPQGRSPAPSRPSTTTNSSSSRR